LNCEDERNRLPTEHLLIN